MASDRTAKKKGKSTMSQRNTKLSSMTGYGRAEGSFEAWSWVWEARSVNGKNLDMRMRIPPGFESLEPKIRKAVGKKLARGNLQISLNVQSIGGDGSYAINEGWLNTLIEKGQEYTDDGKVGRPRLDGLYLVKGVVMDGFQSASDPAFEPRNTAILAGLDDMLDSLKKARAAEGQALAQMLDNCVERFAELAASARNCSGAQLDQIRQKLDEKLKELLADDMQEDRLATETALLAVKADVREELDRLDAHIAQARKLLEADGAIGRKLDFLSQEFIREINTMCSKSTDIELTQVGLEMKSIIEQFREQAANVE
jgi:uncharacterized protein (TIGR00255 family)